MRRQRTNSIDDNGYDSFLDIIANLVGILVILIMVVGLQARNAWQAQTQPQPALVDVEVDEERPSVTAADHQHAIETLDAEIAAIRQQTGELTSDAHVLSARAATIAEQTAVAAARRNQLQMLVSAIENEMTIQRAKLQEDEQVSFDAAQTISTYEHDLEDVKSKIHTVNLETLAPTELTHDATPLAKTVFGREEHYRVLAGRVVRVPLDALVESLRDDAQSKLWKMKETDEITESLSPLDGFRMKYTMKRVEQVLDTPSGRIRQHSIELDRFTLYPTSDDLGEPIQTALSDSSALEQQLARLVPSETTITIWTYPDSYIEFRQLQEHLTLKGFQVAARPLPDGHPIGGSPGGNRSAAQ